MNNKRLNMEYILENKLSGSITKYDTITEIVKYFIEKDKYKIPNFLKEELNRVKVVYFTSNNIPYSLSLKQKQ